MTTDTFWHVSGKIAKKFRDMFGRHTAENLLNALEKLGMFRVRRHWVVLLKVLLPTVGVIIAALWLSLLVSGASWRGVQWFLWSVALGAVLHFAWKVLDWWDEIITVTYKQFMVNKGIITKREFVMPITQVTNWEFKRTVGGRLLGYGTLRVDSAGQNHDLETIEYLPQEVYTVISKLFGKEVQETSAR